jgi:hypothetical protein
MTAKLLILVAALGLVYAEVDLERSIRRIRNQIAVTSEAEHAPKWNELPALIEAALPCLAGGNTTMFKVETDRLPPTLKHYIEAITPLSMAHDLLQVNWDEVSAKRSIEPNGLAEDLKEFMSKPQFVTIHNQIWKSPESEEFIDLLDFIKEAKYPKIYGSIREFYIELGREDLTVDIPEDDEEDVTETPPVSQPPSSPVQRTASLPKPAAYDFPTITMTSSVFKQKTGSETQAECGLEDLLPLLKMLNDSNIHEVIKVFLYAIQEVLGNAAMHILLMKVGEPQKGEFFHNTLARPEMEEFLPLVQGIVLNEAGIGQLNEILRQVTGLNLHNPDLFKYVVDLLQYLIWNLPFPN